MLRCSNVVLETACCLPGTSSSHVHADALRRYLTPPEAKDVLLSEINDGFADNIRINAALDKYLARNSNSYNESNYDYEAYAASNHGRT